jgi:anti-sigma factor ChrR (cupin superfamily)
MATELNVDRSQAVVIDTEAMEWEKSPAPGVWRKRLELIGEPEAGQVTSIVRYDPGSRFPEHPHPDGEEIFVLEGVFSDEHGDYPAGSYIFNPEGVSHSPFSKDGCTLFVKLRQAPGKDRAQVRRDSTQGDWAPGEVEDFHRQVLNVDEKHGETAFLARFGAGVQLPPHGHPGGEEILVIEGELIDEDGRYPKGTWLRLPRDSGHAPSSETGCLILVKRGHL